jgi:riboflavin-specific deaminase-like protein
MRRLVPDRHDLALADTYAGLVLPAPAADRSTATVALGMVVSVDGAVAVAGRSGGLGGEADGHAFRRLRDACDAILVGAGTVRAEDYGPPRATPGRASSRRERGLAPAPQLLVVSGRLDLDPSSRLFAATREDGVPPPLVITSRATAQARGAALAGHAEIASFGDDEVDLAGALRWCRERGWDRVLCEGGPALNGTLLEADLVDEVFLTLAPQLVGGDAGRIVRGPNLGPQRLELTELHEHAGELLLRYRVQVGRPFA